LVTDDPALTPWRLEELRRQVQSNSSTERSRAPIVEKCSVCGRSDLRLMATSSSGKMCPVCIGRIGNTYTAPDASHSPSFQYNSPPTQTPWSPAKWEGYSPVSTPYNQLVTYQSHPGAAAWESSSSPLYTPASYPEFQPNFRALPAPRYRESVSGPQPPVIDFSLASMPQYTPYSGVYPTSSYTVTPNMYQYTNYTTTPQFSLTCAPLTSSYLPSSQFQSSLYSPSSPLVASPLFRYPVIPTKSTHPGYLPPSLENPHNVSGYSTASRSLGATTGATYTPRSSHAYGGKPRQAGQ
jgi:hypothetical protein